MLREDYVVSAAAVHMKGARLVRDAAAALLPCGTFAFPHRALAAQRIFTQAERLLGVAADLSGGLLRGKILTKFTKIAEARTRLAGVPFDESVYARCEAAERTSTVTPGTRGEIYEGFRKLSAQAAACAEDFLRFADEWKTSVEEGRCFLAVPLPALAFLRLAVADYGAASGKLAAGEGAKFLRRQDAAEKYARCLRQWAAASGSDGALSASDGMTALSCSGKIPGIPPMLFEILLQYESLPAAGCT